MVAVRVVRIDPQPYLRAERRSSQYRSLADTDRLDELWRHQSEMAGAQWPRPRPRLLDAEELTRWWERVAAA